MNAVYNGAPVPILLYNTCGLLVFVAGNVRYMGSVLSYGTVSLTRSSRSAFSAWSGVEVFSAGRHFTSGHGEFGTCVLTSDF